MNEGNGQLNMFTCDNTSGITKVKRVNIFPITTPTHELRFSALSTLVNEMLLLEQGIYYACLHAMYHGFPQRPVTLHQYCPTGMGTWSTNNHRQFPSEFKALVKTVVMAAQFNKVTQTPYHPDCPLTLLPFELIEKILMHAAEITYGWPTIELLSSFSVIFTDGHVFSPLIRKQVTGSVHHSGLGELYSTRPCA